ncbi:protein dopey-2-like [Megalops cyprinoides]|uniref:protein dopey-2-like n=1 Tax=Megalops cyprinoides TaxID=118141 RepID=UPI001863B34A|nr:protein dopey-2-like [Megalops cyprinoides]
MDPEEQELQDDHQYQIYSAAIEKALRSFQSSSEWADLISSLGKLNKALQSNLKYYHLPKRLIICKHLAQCLHPALPSGVHLKALETYEVVFKIIGTKSLAKDLFIYSSGLFPLLGHAAMSVRPVLLTLYERYYLPLQRALLPSLQAFVMGLLPGMEEGVEVYDRTDALLAKLSRLVGQQVFYGALWNSILINPQVRMPASLFIVTHFERADSGRDQRYMLGSNHRLVVSALARSLQDSSVLVQRNMLEILLLFFPLYTSLDPEKGSIPMTQGDLVTIVSAACLTLLRRDVSLNRRLYAWLLGTDTKGDMVGVDPDVSTTMEQHTAYYFGKYSRELLVQALMNNLEQTNEHTGPGSIVACLRPFQIIISLQDKPEIGSRIRDDLLLDVVRALYRYCRKILGKSIESSLTEDRVASKIKEDRNMSEIIKTVNMLISSFGTQYLWEYMSMCFQACLRGIPVDPTTPVLKDTAAPPSISELSVLIIFLVDIIPLELYPEIQMRYLPQMLWRMLQDLRDHMRSLSLPELTQGLKVCLKLLSKIQMPAADMNMRTDSQGQGESGNTAQGREVGRERLKRDNVWKRGGSVESMTGCVQDVLASFISRYLLNEVEEEEEVRGDTGLSNHTTAAQTVRTPTGDEKSLGAAGQDWGKGFIPCNREEISEECCQVFAAACQLLQECATFPTYLSEDEMETFYTSMFQNKGSAEGIFLPWLRSLMICCLSEDYRVQHVAMSSILELIHYSQSLVQLIEDRYHRYKSSDSNPLSGRLQMVPTPPINPTILKTIKDNTDFYQCIAQILWGQLDTEHQEHHTTCVELFCRLHGLAPSPAICEDVICQELLHGDKTVQLEALHRFSVLWHLMREMQTNWTMSFNRSFDRSLFVVMDNLNSQDGSISAVGQSWLIRALSLNDVVRILEPILLLLLHPRTQRSSIQCIKQNLGAALWAEVEHTPDTMKTEPELPMEELFRTEDKEEEEEEGRKAGEGKEGEGSEHVQSEDANGTKLPSETSSLGSASQQQLEYDETAHNGLLGPEYDTTEEATFPDHLQQADSEHTLESLSSDEEDLDLGLDMESMARLRLLKQEKKKQEAINLLFRHMLLYPQTYDSDRILFAFSMLETLLKTTPCHFVKAVCTTSIDTGSAAQLNLIHALIRRHLQAIEGRSFRCQIQTHSAAPCPNSLLVDLLTCLCLRFLRSHYPPYLGVGPHHLSRNRDVQVKSVVVLTRLMSQLVNVARARDGQHLDRIRHLLSGCKVQQHVLLCLSASMHISQRSGEVQGEGLPEEQDEPSEESLLDLGQVWTEQPLQMELLKLLQVLIVLESYLWPGGAKPGASENQDVFATTPLAREWQTAALYQQSVRMLQYAQAQPIPWQGMFVSAAARALQPRYGFATHPPWVALLSASLPYLGRSLGVIVTPVIAQICKNLDDLVKQYEYESLTNFQSWNLKRENIPPDYPLTLLEGLTTITHFCLLENRKTPVAPDPTDILHARSAVLEELPRLLSTIVLLWAVVRREETHRSNSDWVLSCSTESPFSVYFKSAKLLRQKVLEFLNPLTAHFGVQVMAAVGSVWLSQKSEKRHSKNKILPVVSESQQAIVDLVKSLSTLHIDTVLQLVKAVVGKTHQTKGDQQRSTLFDIPMLQFGYAFIQSVSAETLQENTPALLSLLRECMLLNLSPRGHFLLLGILYNFVTRLPSLDNRKDTRDVQEVTQQILEAVGSIAGSSLEQTSWLSRNLEVKVQPQVCPEEEDPEDMDHYDAVVSSSMPPVYSVQALTLLAEVLAPLLDVVYLSDEKEKAVPLISHLMDYVFPYLKNHSTYNAPSFHAGTQLLSSLSGYAYTKRAWKKETFELFMDTLFFCMDTPCTKLWRSIIDHLLTCEKSMFKDLMSMRGSSMRPFPKSEQKAMLLKRQAFAIFSGEVDQYHLYLPLIQERLKEIERVGHTPPVVSQMFLAFRVLLLRMSSQHLTSLWPVMVSELIHTFVQLEKALMEDQEASNTHSKNGRGAGSHDGDGPALLLSQSELDMYLSACKFLDAALCFPPDRIPLFQMYRWAFVPEVDVDSYSGPGNSIVEGEQECKPHIVRIVEGLHSRFGELNGTDDSTRVENLKLPLLTMHSISSITELMPFFRVLACSFKSPGNDPHPQPVAHYPAHNSNVILKKLEDIIEGEFLERMDN